MAAKDIILVTGGNSGIGYELIRQLLADKNRHVLLGSRSAQKGEKAVKELQSQNQPGTVELLQVDVSSYDSVNAAAQQVSAKHGYLSALVNNAGIASFPAGTPLHEQMDVCFRTNATGAQMMGDAFGPLLEKAPGTARIVNVSSALSLITNRLNKDSPGSDKSVVHYRASKAALDMITANQAVEFGEKGIKVFAFCPGYTVSNLGSDNNAESGAKPTSEGAAPIVEILEGKRDDEHAGFLHGTGQYRW